MGARSPMVPGRTWKAVARCAACGVLLALAGCGGGGSGGGGSGGGGGGGGGATYTLGGTVAGLGNNTGLVLANGSATLDVPANATTFTFASPIASGTAYSVSVQTSPTGLKCTVASGGSGTITANVTNVAVSCAVQSYTLGGTITGLGSASGLVLTNEGSDATTIAANATTFNMNTPVQYGAAYAVAVQTYPTDLNCTVTSGSGTMPAANVTSIQIACTAGAESVLHSFGGTGDGTSPGGSLIQGSDGNLYGMTSSGGANSKGTVFKITPAGAESVLYSFGASASDGAGPDGGLIQATDGNLYGMTSGGGTYGAGTVFKITTAGAETVLYSFGAAGDGANPVGDLLQASDGNFYGTTERGGANGYGTVFEITTAGVETIVHSFGATGTDGINPYGSLIQASDGNLYGTTELGGNNSLGTVFRTNTSGSTYTVLHSFGASGGGSNPYGSLVQAKDGNLYGTTTLGGTNGLGTVFKITTSGTASALYSFGASGTDGTNPYGDLIQAADGNLYGMTQGGGANSEGTVFEITTAGTETVRYSFGSSTNDGTAPKGSLIQASNGTLYGMTPTGGANNSGVVFAIN
jgi:uncharacterized repeat protein (TIGR03803 family)